jgi:hypothetical protein
VTQDFECAKHIFSNGVLRECEGAVLPIPRVENGKWSKERERTKSGRWRRKRSDANKPRKKSNGWKYFLAIVGAAVVVFVVLVLFFPEWLGLPHIVQF